MRCRRWALLFGLVVTAIGGPLGAQDAATGRLKAGDMVRLRTVGRGGPRISGRYAGMVGDTMLLDARTGPAQVRMVVFDSLWTRHRPIVANALRGAAVGALLGGAYRLLRPPPPACPPPTPPLFYLPLPLSPRTTSNNRPGGFGGG